MPETATWFLFAVRTQQINFVAFRVVALHAAIRNECDNALILRTPFESVER